MKLAGPKMRKCRFLTLIEVRKQLTKDWNNFSLRCAGGGLRCWKRSSGTPKSGTFSAGQMRPVGQQQNTKAGGKCRTPKSCGSRGHFGKSRGVCDFFFWEDPFSFLPALAVARLFAPQPQAGDFISPSLRSSLVQRVTFVRQRSFQVGGCLNFVSSASDLS